MRTSGCARVLLIVFAVLAGRSGPAAVAQTTTKPLTALIAKAKQGSARSEYELGRAYDRGTVVKRDDRAAAQWYFRAARQGYAPAEYALAMMFYDTRVPSGDLPSLSVEQATPGYWLQRAARHGSADAEFMLGALLAEQGSYSEAKQHYLKAYATGNISAAGNLGSLYEDRQQYARAAIWFRRAAGKGDAGAQEQLAELYRDGHGVPKDMRQAEHYWLMAAIQSQDQLKKDLGFSASWSAKLNLAKMYRQQGKYAQALHWYRVLVEVKRPDAEAEYGLGQMYEAGQGVPKDCRKAFAWYRKSAVGGNDQAEEWLFHAYSGSHCVQLDNVKAYAWWLDIAEEAIGPDDPLVKEGDDVRRRLSPLQLKAAARLEKRILARQTALLK